VEHGAHGFAARHFAFHPERNWAYLCVERQGELRLYDFDHGGIALEPRAIASTLDGVPAGPSSQLASAVHVHPSGRFVYVSNRARDTVVFAGYDVFVGGINDIAVFAIDQKTGQSTLIQHQETHGIFPRTFGIDRDGQFLVAGNEQAGYVRAGDAVRRVVPSLAAYRIAEDGRLTHLRTHEFPDNGDVCFWMDVLSPADPSPPPNA
jgi:6-phosphogluconolactonase